MKLIAAILFLGPIYPTKLVFTTLECIPRKSITHQIEPSYDPVSDIYSRTFRSQIDYQINWLSN